jgi:hypothetical protein
MRKIKIAFILFAIAATAWYCVQNQKQILNTDNHMIEEEKTKDYGETDYFKLLEIVNADYGTCYTIGNYQLCPERKLIKVGRMFGTAVKDAFGFFPDSTLKYDEVTMIIIAGNVIIFYDNPDFNINWQTIRFFSFQSGFHYFEFTDGKILYNIREGKSVHKSEREYDKNTYSSRIENKLPYRRAGELTEDFYAKGNTFYFDRKPILETFDVPNLRIIVSEGGFETYYITDGKQVIFGGGKTGYSSTEKNGKEYVLAKRWMIDGVDLTTLRVLGRNILADKNNLYYETNVIPFDKLNGFKIIIREM